MVADPTREHRVELPSNESMIEEIDAAIVGPRRYTRQQTTDESGVAFDRATRLWRAMGFPVAGDDEVLFTDRDVAALRTADALLKARVVDEDGLLTLTRAMAQAVSRLAVTHATVAVDHIARLTEEIADPELADAAAEELIPSVASLLEYVWRRHLAVAVDSAFAVAEGDVPVAVGFADLVGFTETSRQATAEQLGRLVEEFERLAAPSATDHGGRIVKTLGDEVLFTAPTAADAASLALDLAAQAAAAGSEVRVGVAYGPVLARLGDVFGPTVNIASRLTGLAHPGTVLVDRGAAMALRDDDRYDVSPLRRQAVRGYSHLAPFRLRPRG
jgi:adenylate cyclase